MGRLMLAVAAALALCGPAGAFDFPAKGFVENFNKRAVEAGTTTRASFDYCRAETREGPHCFYRLGRNAAVQVSAYDTGKAYAVSVSWREAQAPDEVVGAVAIIARLCSPSATEDERAALRSKLLTRVSHGDSTAPEMDVNLGHAYYSVAFDPVRGYVLEAGDRVD